MRVINTYIVRLSQWRYFEIFEMPFLEEHASLKNIMVITPIYELDGGKWHTESHGFVSEDIARELIRETQKQASMLNFNPA